MTKTVEQANRDHYTQWLFEQTVIDLRERVNFDGLEAAVTYRRLGIAPLLRKLLLDDSPLVHQVRRDRQHVPLEFRLPTFSMPDESKDGMRLVAVIPTHLHTPDADALPLTLKQFLASNYGFVGSTHITVKNLIRFFSHVDGGVHHGQPDNETESMLAQMTPAILAMRSGGLTGALVPLARSVIDACAPLLADMRARPAAFYSGNTIIPRPLIPTKIGEAAVNAAARAMAEQQARLGETER